MIQLSLILSFSNIPTFPSSIFLVIYPLFFHPLVTYPTSSHLSYNISFLFFHLSCNTALFLFTSFPPLPSTRFEMGRRSNKRDRQGQGGDQGRSQYSQHGHDVSPQEYSPQEYSSQGPSESHSGIPHRGMQFRDVSAGSPLPSARRNWTRRPTSWVLQQCQQHDKP